MADINDINDDNVAGPLDLDIDPLDDIYDKFHDFDNKIKFHIYDPDKYVNNIHNEITIVSPSMRRSSEVITKYEFTDVVSNRAKHIENGGRVFVEIEDESCPIKIAEKEIRLKKCPLTIRRLISANIAELWNVNEMTIPYI